MKPISERSQLGRFGRRRSNFRSHSCFVFHSVVAVQNRRPPHCAGRPVPLKHGFRGVRQLFHHPPHLGTQHRQPALIVGRRSRSARLFHIAHQTLLQTASALRLQQTPLLLSLLRCLADSHGLRRQRHPRHRSAPNGLGGN